MSALGYVYTALKTLIGSDVTTIALLAPEPFSGAGVNGKAIYDDGGAPQNATMPRISVGAGTEIQQSTIGARGWNCTVQVKVTTQGTGPLPVETGQAIVRALSTLLMPIPPRPLTVAGFSSCWVDDFSQQPTLITTVAGVVTREWPIIVRVFAT